MNGDAPEDPVRRDDELLDALRRGASPPADDPVAALLAGWHTEIEARAARLDDGTWHAADAADGQRPPDPETAVRLDRPAAGVRATPGADGSPGTTEPAAPGAVGSPGSAPRRGRPGRAPRRTRVLSGAALALVLVTGGIWRGSAEAEPGGLLWPVTELVWAERAESLVAEREIDRLLDQARRDLGAGRYAEARHDLERANALLVHLSDGRRAVRLRIDIDDLRQRLPEGDVPDTSPGGPPPTGPDGTAPTGPDGAGAPQTPAATPPTPPGTPPAPPQPGAPASQAATTPAAAGTVPMRTAPTRPVRTPASGGHRPTPGGDTAGKPPATRPGRTAPDRPATNPAAANPTAADRGPTRGRPETRAPAHGPRSELPPAAGPGEMAGPAAAAGHPEPAGGRAGGSDSARSASRSRSGCSGCCSSASTRD